MSATLDEPVAAGTVIQLVRDGKVVASHTVTADSEAVTFSTADVETSGSYEIWVGGEAGSLDGATRAATVEAMTGSSGGMGGGPMGGGPDRP